MHIIMYTKTTKQQQTRKMETDQKPEPCNSPLISRKGTEFWQETLVVLTSSHTSPVVTG